MSAPPENHDKSLSQGEFGVIAKTPDQELDMARIRSTPYYQRIAKYAEIAKTDPDFERALRAAYVMLGLIGGEED